MPRRAARTDAKQYLIRLPWPVKQLNPNFKRANHWSKYRKHEKAYLEACWALTLKIVGARPNFEAPLPVEITFSPPDRRKRDRDNIIGSFKNGQDGMCNALGIDDSDLRQEYVFSDPVKGGCVLVHIKPGGAG